MPGVGARWFPAANPPMDFPSIPRSPGREDWKENGKAGSAGLQTGPFMNMGQKKRPLPSQDGYSPRITIPRPATDAAVENHSPPLLTARNFHAIT